MYIINARVRDISFQNNLLNLEIEHKEIKLYRCRTPSILLSMVKRIDKSVKIDDLKSKYVSLGMVCDTNLQFYKWVSNNYIKRIKDISWQFIIDNIKGRDIIIKAKSPGPKISIDNKLTIEQVKDIICRTGIQCADLLLPGEKDLICLRNNGLHTQKITQETLWLTTSSEIVSNKLWYCFQYKDEIVPFNPILYDIGLNRKDTIEQKIEYMCSDEAIICYNEVVRMLRNTRVTLDSMIPLFISMQNIFKDEHISLFKYAMGGKTWLYNPQGKQKITVEETSMYAPIITEYHDIKVTPELTSSMYWNYFTNWWDNTNQGGSSSDIEGFKFEQTTKISTSRHRPILSIPYTVYSKRDRSIRHSRLPYEMYTILASESKDYFPLLLDFIRTVIVLLKEHTSERTISIYRTVAKYVNYLYAGGQKNDGLEFVKVQEQNNVYQVITRKSPEIDLEMTL